MTNNLPLGTLVPNWLRRLLAVVGALVMLATVSISVAPAASAATVSSANLRPCVDTNNSVCSPVGTTGPTTLYKIRCWRDGSWATGAYRSNRWFLIALHDGREGYVHSSLVRGQYATPNCGTLAYVKAADFALSQVGRVYATDAVASRYSDWVPGPHAEWSGDCAKLPHYGFAYVAGVPYATGNAIDQYHSYRRAGKIYGGLPRYGDPVFYDIVPGYGHTAIYVGGTTIISTMGLDHARKPVARTDINTFANYLGWALVG